MFSPSGKDKSADTSATEPIALVDRTESTSLIFSEEFMTSLLRNMGQHSIINSYTLMVNLPGDKKWRITKSGSPMN